MTDENGQAAPKVDASELASMMVGGGMVGSRSDWGLFTQKHKIGGSAKGSSQYDPFAKEQFLAFEELDLHECVQIHEHHWLAQRYVSRTSRDMTREGIDLEVEGDSDHDVAVAVMQKLNQLDYRTMFQRMVEDELVLGDGMLALGTDESDLDIGEELNEDQVSDVLFLSPFNRLDVSRAEEDKDIWSLNFGGILRYEMAPMIMENSEALERAVHRSRVLHLQTRPQKGSVWGIPMFQYLYPILQNITNTDWTIGHVLRKMVVLVYKSDKLMEQLMKSVDGQTGKVDWSKVGQFHEQLKMETNVLSQLVMGSEDELSTVSFTEGAGPIGEFLEFLWDEASGSTGMPKSFLRGTQSGEVSGAREDSMRWADHIHGMQDNDLRDPLTRLIRLIMKSMDVDPDEIDWSLQFLPIRKPTELEEAERQQREADAFKASSAAVTTLAKSGLITDAEARDLTSRMSGVELDPSMTDDIPAPEDEEGEDGSSE